MIPSNGSVRILALLALSIGAYAPSLTLPFIADDYHQIPLARMEAKAGWAPLLHDQNLRTRATYMFLSAALDRCFGFRPIPFYAVSIVLHALCVLMVYALGNWPPIGKSVGFWAACVFAVHEQHQEAIMWLAAAYDLIVFLFGMAALLCWIEWQQTRKWAWYAASLVSILIAAISKETFWVFVVLMVAVAAWEPRRRALIGLVPFLVISLAYVAFMFTTRVAPGARLDDRFAVLGTKWIFVAMNSLWRLVFPQGLLAIATLLWIRRRADRGRVVFAGLWILLGLAPHSFLTYMPYLASRHTYLASGGLALLAGVALARVSKKIPIPTFAAICMVILTVNVEILWVKKMSQFRERAEPTELLKAAAARAAGPIVIDCTPVPEIVVEDALASVGSRAIFRSPRTDSDPQRFAIEYTDRNGSTVRIDRLLGHKHGAFY
ncbi:MAG TPA: hypothetical protein VNX18_11675 [Bryobacteraceae bacterium]|nr:hypothetical protein [Bryobacteraceae bacterium]